MKQYIKEILSLMGEDKKKLPWLFLLFFSVSFLDVLGIGLIAPYISLVVDPEFAYIFFDKYVQWINLPDDVNSLVKIMSVILLLVFLVKTLSSIWISYIIVKFTTSLRVKLSVKLMTSYQNLRYVEYLRRNSSEYIHATQNLVSEYANSSVQTGLGMISNLIVGIVILGMLAISGPKVIEKSPLKYYDLRYIFELIMKDLDINDCDIVNANESMSMRFILNKINSCKSFNRFETKNKINNESSLISLHNLFSPHTHTTHWDHI